MNTSISAGVHPIDHGELYRLLVLELTDYAVFLIETSGRIATWNEGVARILGYQENEFLGQPFACIFSLEDKTAGAPEQELATAVRAGRSDDERWHIRKDGSRFWCEGVVTALTSEEGRLLGFSKIMRDATRRKQAEDALNANQERLRASLLDAARRTAEMNAVFASMPDAVYVGDENGIQDCNGLALQMWGFKSKDELQRPVSALADLIQTRRADTGELLRNEEQPFLRALHGESCIEEVSTRNVVTGEEVIVRCTAGPIRLDGQVVGAVAVNSDITAQKRTQQEREKLLRALQLSNEELTQFSSIVSHDLQAPLRAIRIFAELLQRKYQGKLDETADEFIGSILDGTSGMEELIRALLQYAQAGEQVTTLEAVSVSEVLEVVQQNLIAIIGEANAKVEYRDMPAIQADWVRTVQLFQNLIGNAIKYRQKDISPVIKITAQREANDWVFAVADNGIGIDGHSFERIFEPLKRLHGREIPGTGIGLSVCKKIVQNLGGTIWVESETGKGSIFYFTIPV